MGEDAGVRRPTVFLVMGAVIVVAVVATALRVAGTGRGGTITGGVRDPQGEPVADALVTATYRRWTFRDGQLLWDDPVIFEARTDVDGTFRIAYEGRRTVRFRVFASGFRPHEQEVRGDATLAVTLDAAEPFVQPQPRPRRPDEPWPDYYCDELEETVRYWRVDHPTGTIEIGDQVFEAGDMGPLHPVRRVSNEWASGWSYSADDDAPPTGLVEGGCADFLRVPEMSEGLTLTIPESSLQMGLDVVER